MRNVFNTQFFVEIISIFTRLKNSFYKNERCFTLTKEAGSNYRGEPFNAVEFKTIEGRKGRDVDMIGREKF